MAQGQVAAGQMPWIEDKMPSELARGLNGPHRAYWAGFLKAKFDVNNFFAYYRAGRALEPGEPWKWENAAKNQNSILYKTRMGKFGRIAGAWETIYQPDGALGIPRRATRQRYPVPLPPNDPRKKASLDSRGRASSRRIQALMQAKGIDIQVKRILGAGGNGVALLCDAASQARGRRGREFVLKADIRGNSMREEKDYMMVCQDASSTRE